jgi:hypothetical protein
LGRGLRFRCVFGVDGLRCEDNCDSREAALLESLSGSGFGGLPFLLLEALSSVRNTNVLSYKRQ